MMQPPETPQPERGPPTLDLAEFDRPSWLADRERFRVLTGASTEVMDDLDAYFALLSLWSGRMNLVGPSARQDFWIRHTLDSAQLLRLAPDANTYADLGAGAGFPGLVLAIFLKAKGSGQVVLVESMAKRCLFLRTVSTALNLPTEVHNARAESLNLSPVDVVTARACAPLPRLLQYAEPHLRGKTVGLFLKGRDAASEIASARNAWRFEAECLNSLSDPDGRIIKVQRLRRV